MRSKTTAIQMEPLSSKHMDGILVIAIAGRVDSNNASQIEAGVLKNLGIGLDRLVIDLTELEYISSAGLRVLLITAKKMRQFGGRFALANLRPQISEVMQVSGFTAIIPCAATLDDALAMVSAN